MMNHVQTLWLEWIGMVDQTANDFKRGRFREQRCQKNNFNE